MDLLLQKIYEVVEANNDSIFRHLALEPVRTMDLYRGQPLNPEKFEYFETPALFFDYAITSWEKKGNSYAGNGSIDVHVVVDSPFDGTSNIFTNKAESLRRVFYYKIVRRLLDNLESENTSKLIRRDERPVDTGVIVYHVLPYTFSYYDPEQINSNTITIGNETLEIVGKLVKKI